VESLPSVPTSVNKDDREFWCAIESDDEGIRPVSLEILSSSAFMAAKYGGKVCAVVVGPPLGIAQLQQLSAFGADKVYHALATASHPDEVVALYSEKIAALRPFSVLFPATSTGKLLAPRIAARLNLGLTGDCVGLNLDEEGRLVQLKPAFGGNIIARILSKTFPQMATIRPGALTWTRPRDAQRIPVVAWAFPGNLEHQFKIVQEITDRGSEAEKLDHAKVIVCVGTGLGQENLDLAFRIAELSNGAVGATRRVVDHGWLPRQHQIGLTGKFVAPSVYLGLGVSGRYNHTIGIQKANKIIAINQDPNAEILKIADLGILGDCVGTSRRIIEALEEGV
jgi:electron transfer flavoprotein alpha subunit